MHVAVYVSDVPADAGGGYTFEMDVLEGLLDVHTESAHKLSFICPPSSISGLAEKLKRSGLPMRAIAVGWHEHLMRPLLHGLPFLRARWRGSSPIDNAADAAGADLIWFLGAGSHRTDRPYIAVVWDVQHRVTPWFPELSERGAWDIRDLANGWFLQRATKVVVGTSIGQAEIDRFYQIPSDRTIVLPHPTPSFALTADASMRAELPAHLSINRPYLLYPAQFWAHKNHVNLLLALKELRDRHKMVLDLALVGSDKGNRKHVEQVARDLGLSDAVHFLGFVSRNDLIALYRNALGLAYVSWAGPENLPPLEAFAFGCPVVATRIPGAEEQLGESALFVAPGDPSDIAAGIAKLRDDVIRARLISAGIKRAHRWTSQDYARGVFKAVDELEPIIRCWRQV